MPDSSGRAASSLLSSHPAAAGPVSQQEAGFTLLEVLVAFIIAAMALALVFQGVIGGLQSANVAGKYEEALSRARSHLAAVGHGAELRRLEQEGDDGSGYHWRLRVVPVTSATAASGARIGLYAISVVISWGEPDHPRTVQLETERVGPPQGGGA
jgi:general secretion pathway protein I